MPLRPKWIFHNIGLKITAFVFALIVWIYIQGELGINPAQYWQAPFYEKKTFKDISIDVLMTSSHALMVKVRPQSFDLTIEGKTERLNSILSGDILVFVDVRSIQSEGVYQIPVKIENIPSEVNIVGKLPLVEVLFEKKSLEIPKASEIKSPADTIMGI